ncbi:thiosulfate/3-mercaptopyruvate sulfurtransferase [Massilia sp. UYP11]|uniref:sulfurtransferase n=1 Tax=Massilia sp. UYP11 TaxID=1756385 RepID=UPI003D1BC0C0
MNTASVIEPDALAAGRPLRLLDVRDVPAFDAAHATKAIRVPIEEWEAAAKADTTGLDNVAYWEQAIRQLGIDDHALAVVYDDGRMTEAARVWFILQYFGVRATILNGGWPALSSPDIPAEWIASGSAAFHASPDSGRVGLTDRVTLQSELEDGIDILDARTVAEFRGEDLRRNKRGGHIPGARHLPHGALLIQNRLRHSDELRQLLAEAGFQSGDDIITHCDGEDAPRWRQRLPFMPVTTTCAFTT